MSENRARVLVTSDRLKALQLHDLLIQEGIRATLIGPANPACLGASDYIFEWTIEVLADDYERAASVIRAYSVELEVDDPGELPWELRLENGPDEQEGN